MSNPVAKVEYQPSKELTIRHILSFPKPIIASIRQRPSIHVLSQEAQRREAKTLSYLLLLSFVIAIPTFVIGVLGMTLLPKSNPLRIWCEEIILGGCERAVVALFVLGTIAQLAVNQHFVLKSWRIMKVSSKSSWRWSRLIHFGSMDLLVALSTVIAYLASLGLFIRDIFRPHEDAMQKGTTTYFDSSVFLGFFILMGRVLEHYTRMKTSDAISMLEDASPDHALLLSESYGDHLLSAPAQKISADLVEIGDLLLLPAGGVPCADGVIVAGSSAFDESSLTGEALPVTKDEGDAVMTGTKNLSSPIVFRVDTVGQETMMRKIIRVVAEGQSKKCPIQVLAEKITSIFVPVVVYISLLVLVVWLIVFLCAPASSVFPRGRSATSDRIAAAFQFAIAVLVVACPCGIGLAAPTAQAVGSGLLAKAGILAQGGGEAFQLASKVDIVVFDKTGTLTKGEAAVTTSYLINEGDGWLWEALRLAEATSTHPLAQAIVSYCQGKKPPSPSSPLQMTSCEEVAGRGVRATFLFAGEQVQFSVGNEDFLSQDANFQMPNCLIGIADLWRNEGNTVVFVLRRDSNGSSVPLMLGIADQIRDGFEQTIASLKDSGKDVYMLTGDNERTARAVARKVGLDDHHVKAGTMPLEKALFINTLKQRRRPVSSKLFGIGHSSEKNAIVAFIGDGLNDSAALAAADIGIALSHGSQVSIASASFVLISDRCTPQAVMQLFRISSRVYRRQITNFGWAMLYNIALIPVAAGVLYPYRHTELSPVWSSLAMALSSVSVVVSSLALKWGL